MDRNRGKNQLERIISSKKFSEFPTPVKSELIKSLKQETEKKFYTRIVLIATFAIVTVVALILYFTHSISNTTIVSICAVVMVVVIVVVTRSTKGIKDIIGKIFRYNNRDT